jgi:hypothetical protein
LTPTGRNAPCPCGSGRRFKHCCLAKQQTVTTAYTGQDRRSAFAKLVRFSERAEFAEDIRLADILFRGGRYDFATAAQREELEADEQSRLAFLEWFLLDHDLFGEDGTIAERFLAARGADLSAAERTLLERLSASCLRPYQVAEVRPDEGLGLRDLWTDDVIQVRERLATRQLVRWDILAVRVVPGPDGGLVLEGVPHLYPPEARDDILAELRRIHRRHRRHSAADDPAVFFKRIGMVFHHLWLDHVALRAMPTVVTAEGDPLAPTKTVFDIAHQARVSAALEGHPALERQDDGSFTWLQPTESYARILGTITIGAGRLTVEAMSESRADHGRQFIEQLLGDAVRFRVTSSENFEHTLAVRSRDEPELASTLPPELEQEVLAQFYDQHYRTWPDVPLPALGGRTPRKAAKLKTVRPKLEAVLRQLENRTERDRLAGRPAADLAWLWSELGLERP